jgi:hypothetical protein
MQFPVLALFAAAGLMAADAPYAGKWTLNPARSDFGDTTLAFEQMAGGEMKQTADGLSYTFKTDGKEYATPWGSTAAWKAVDSQTWQVTHKANGKVVSNDTLTVSADGKTLTAESNRIKANGETSKDVLTFQRVSGGPGLAGKWKTKNLKMSSPSVLAITPSGTGGLTLTFVDEKANCAAKFDGRDYPATGPIWPPGWTCSIAKNGDRAFDVTWKKDGKPLYKGTFTASGDGKTLTEVAGAVATTEKIKAVYDRR